MGQTKLCRLNQLLAQEPLHIPDFRRKVGRNGSNLTWLRRAIQGKEPSAELSALLSMEIPQLIQPIDAPH